MGRLTDLIPTRFAQSWATDGLFKSCDGLLSRVIEAASSREALAVLAGAAAGPAAFLGIYGGMAFLEWKRDERKAEAVKAQFRGLHAALNRIGDGVHEQKELAGLLKELLERDAAMRERLERAEQEATSPEAAFESVLNSTLGQLVEDTDENFDNVRIFLSNISTWVVEGFERVEANQAITHEKLDQLAAGQREILANQRRIEARLEAIESTPAAMPSDPDARPERPPLRDEDGALFDAYKPFADALTLYRIAVAEGDDERAEELEPEVEQLRNEQRAEEDFVFFRARGDRHFFAGRYDEAIEPYRAALEIKPDEPSVANNLALALLNLRKISDHGEELAEAEGLLRRVLDLRRAMHEDESPDMARHLNNLASVLHAMGRWDEALTIANEAVERSVSLYEDPHPLTATSLSTLSVLLCLLGRPDEAEPYQVLALKMRQLLAGGDSPLVVRSLNNLGALLHDLRRSEEAESLHREALAMCRRLYAGDHQNISWSLHCLANALEELDRHDEAEPVYEECLTMLRHIYPGDHPQVAGTMSNLAGTRRELHRGEEALPLHREAVAMCRRLYPGDHPTLAAALSNWAFTLGTIGRWDEALGPCEESLAMTRRYLPEGHPDLVLCEQNLMYIRDQLGLP